jgi:hypothetical protein
MAIDFTRLFTTTGKIIGGLNLINAHRGASLATRIDTIDNRYETFGQDIAVGLYEALEANRDDNDGLVTYLQDLMEDTLIAEVKADRPLIQETKEAALVELDRQMRVSVQSLEDSPATAVVTPALVNGNAKLIASTTHGNGVVAQLALPDTYLVSVPLGFLGGDTPFKEVLAYAGTAARIPPTDWDWPGGSGVEGSISVVDADDDVGLTNGKLDSLTGWTDQVGGTWTVGAGTVALRTDYTDNVFKFAPSGAAGSIQQAIDVRAETTYTWTLKVYKHSGVQTWDVKVSLYDSSGVIATATTTTASASLTASAWNTLAGFFTTPKFMNGQVYFRIEYLNIVASSNLEVAHAGFAEVTPIYTGGPFLFAWAGTLPLTTNDKWSVAVTIGGTGALHRGLDRLLDVRSVLPTGLPVLPLASPPTQLDSLVS